MKKLLCVIALLAVMLSLCAVTVSANAPIIPDIVITLDEPYDGDYVVAVLSDRNAFYSYDEQWYNDFKNEDGTEAMWAAVKKLRSVKDEDGYDYIAHLDPFNRSNKDTGVQYPYDSFKIAVYYPDSDFLTETGILVREKYIQLYQLTMNGKSITGVQSKQDSENGVFRPAVTAVRPYYQEQLLFRFLASLAINLAVEILIALTLGYRTWRHIITIAVTNLITLFLLTVSVLLINPPVYDGLLSFPFAFFEIAVAAVEATVYAIAFKRFEKGKKYRPWLAVIYAFIANLITYFIGAYLYIIPH